MTAVSSLALQASASTIKQERTLGLPRPGSSTEFVIDLAHSGRNPLSASITVDVDEAALDSTAPLSLTVADAQGRVLLDHDIEGSTSVLPLGHLSPGVSTRLQGTIHHPADSRADAGGRLRLEVIAGREAPQELHQTETIGWPPHVLALLLGGIVLATLLCAGTVLTVRNSVRRGGGS